MKRKRAIKVDSNLPNNLKTFRYLKGYSNAIDFCKDHNINWSTYTRIEAGYNCNLNALLNICKNIGLDISKALA